MSIISNIAGFSMETDYGRIPDEIKKLAVTALVDYVAVTYAGSKRREAEAVRNFVAERRPGGQCRLIGGCGTAAMEDAALINGMTAHLLDYDDAGLAGHPSAVLYSAALAAGESAEKSGKEILRAYILAYEVSLKIADLLMPELTARGWHGTSVFGTLGAAAAASILLELDETEFKNAMGLAASRASGLMVNFGTSAKPFHAGMAAAGGLECALLAKVGLTASEFAIEGRDGYAQTFAGKQVKDSDLYFGEDWAVFRQDQLIKRYPCCSAAHTALDAVSAMAEELELKACDVKRIIVDVPEFTLSNLIYPEPETEMQARFSMNFVLAHTIAAGPLDLKAFSPEMLQYPQTRALMPKISMRTGEAFEGQAYIDNEPAVVTLLTKSGREYKKRVDFAVGTTRNPIGEKALYAKFDSCIGTALSENEKKELYNLLKSADELRSIKKLEKYL